MKTLVHLNTLSLGSQELRRNAAMENQVINVLMVDDDEVDIMNVRRVFQKEKIDHPLFVAQNGRSALTLLADKYLRQDANHPSVGCQNRWLILLDMNLPQMNGLELLRALSQDPNLAAIPVVVLISSAQDQARFERKGIQVMGYMTKPVIPDRLIAIIAAATQMWERTEQEEYD
jgi:CheY-like chemotaxis protein